MENHYISVIGNAILVNDKFYYEVEILELGEDTDLIFGIISYDSLVCCQEKYRNSAISKFNNSYTINLNKHYEIDGMKKRCLIKKGDIISIKIDLIENYIYFFINNKIINIISYYTSWPYYHNKYY